MRQQVFIRFPYTINRNFIIRGGEYLIDLGSIVAHLVVEAGNGIQDLIDFGQQSGEAGSQAEILSGALKKLAAGFAIAAVIKKAVEALAACAKMSDELQKALNTLQTQTGATDESMTEMEQSLKNIYANNYGESFEDIAQAMGEVQRQTGLTGEALEGTTENALALRDTFGFEVNESVRAVDMMMKQFGVTSDEAYNMIAQGAQKGLDKNGNLLDSINEYSVHFKQLGFDSEEMFNMFANGAEMGVFDIDKLGDAVKEFGIRAKDGSTTTVEAFELLGLNAEELQGRFAEGGDTAKQAFQEVAAALNNCDDEVVKNTAGVNLFGTMWEDMGADAVKALSDTNGSISMTADSLEKIKEIKYDSVGEAFEGIKRQLEVGIMIPIGEKILPILNQLANWISSHIPQIQATFESAMAVIGDTLNAFMGMLHAFFQTVQGESEIFHAVWEGMKTIVTVFFDVVQQVFQVFKAAFEGDWNTLWNSLKGLVETVLNGVGQILQSCFEIFKALISGAWENIKTNTVNVWNMLKAAISQALQAIKNSISNTFQSLVKVVADSLTKMVNKAKEFIGNMKQAGKDLIEGLINGIKEKLSGAVDAISGVATGVVNRIKSIFSIHSPSRVFYEIGAFVVQGLADGINENGGNAVGEMENLAGKILSTGDALSTGIITKDKETNQLIYNNLYDTVMSKIDMYYQDRDKRVSLMEEGTEENIKSVQREVKETEKATDLKIKLYQQEYKAKMQLVDDETNDILDGLQAELDAMDEMEQRKQRQQEQEEYNNKMQELYTKLQIAEEEEKQGIFEEIEKTEADRKKVLEKQALNDKKENIRQQMEEARKEATEKKKQLQEELEQKEYILQQQRAAEVSHLNEVIKLMQKQVEKKKELEKVQTEIAKKEAEEQSKIKAAEAESQSEKVSEELTKQTTTSKIADTTQTQNTLEELKAREQNLISDINHYGTLIQGKVAAAKATEEEITKVIEEETAKRTAILSGSTGKVTEEETGQQTAVTAEQATIQTEILKGQTEEQNSITEGQTLYRTGQWDYQTKYYGQKSEQQTKESNVETKKQSDYLTAQLKYRTAQFAQAIQQMLAQVRSFSANVKTTAYQCGQDFYNGIRSTEEDIRRYIERMARELREALESAMDYDGTSISEIDGSHRNGLAYVPYDNYNAILHKGERVLTAAENRNYGSGNNGEKKQVDIHITQNIYSPTPNPRQEQKRAIREFKKLSLGV